MADPFEYQEPEDLVLVPGRIDLDAQDIDRAPQVGLESLSGQFGFGRGIRGHG